MSEMLLNSTIRRALAFTAFAALVFGAMPGPAYAASIPAAVSAAVADPARPDADKAVDADRKPAESVAFAGVKPGEKVADLLPGGGYFTRIFAKVVGPKGHVYATVPAEQAAARVKAIVDDPAYSNVSVLVQPFATFTAPEPLDVVWTSRNYHDLHNKMFNLDVAAFNKAIFNSLKPGGTYIVLDHAAETGSGARDTETLHRIDPALVKTEVVAAGFVFDGDSKVLHNPDDNHTGKVFDAAVKGKTDQFILKFHKPR